MKNKILDFLVRTQKATAALLAATTAVASATFLPSPWAAYAAVAGLVLTWLLTYVFPFVSQAVEAFPFDEPASDADHSAVELSSGNEVQVVEAPLTGEVLDPFPATVEIPVQRSETTVGIPVVEGPTAEGSVPEGRVTVDQILNRIEAEAV